MAFESIPVSAGHFYQYICIPLEAPFCRKIPGLLYRRCNPVEYATRPQIGKE